MAFDGYSSGNHPYYWNGVYNGYDGYDVTPLSGHDAFLPNEANAADATDSSTKLAFSYFPFYKMSTYYWSMRAAGSRWECDDYSNSPYYTTLRKSPFSCTQTNRILFF